MDIGSFLIEFAVRLPEIIESCEKMSSKFSEWRDDYKISTQFKSEFSKLEDPSIGMQEKDAIIQELNRIIQENYKPALDEANAAMHEWDTIMQEWKGIKAVIVAIQEQEQDTQKTKTP